MTTHPGEREESGVCAKHALAVSIAKSAANPHAIVLTTEAPRQGEFVLWGCRSPQITRSPDPGRSGRSEKAIDFEHLMESASHSHEFRNETWTQPGGRRLFGGETVSGNRSQAASSGLAFGPLVVVEGRTEWLNFLQKKLCDGADYPRKIRYSRYRFSYFSGEPYAY